jgi:hypothetical protein
VSRLFDIADFVGVPDTTDLDALTPDVGSALVQVSVASMLVLDELATPVSESSAYRSNESLPSANYKVGAVVFRDSGASGGGGAGGPVSGGEFWLAARFSGSLFYLARLEDANQIRLQSFDGATLATLDTFSVSLANDTDYRFELVVDGTTIKVLLDTVEVISVTDSTVATAYQALWQWVSGGGAVVPNWRGRTLYIDSDVGGAGTIYEQSVGASITPSAALARSTSRALSASTTAAGALTKQASRALSASITATASLARVTARRMAASLTPTATLARSPARSLGASVTATASVVRQTLRSLAASITATAVAGRVLSASLAASITPTASLTTLRGIVLSAVITVTRALTSLFTAGPGVPTTPTTTTLPSVRLRILDTTPRLTTRDTTPRLTDRATTPHVRTLQ